MNLPTMAVLLVVAALLALALWRVRKKGACASCGQCGGACRKGAGGKAGKHKA